MAFLVIATIYNSANQRIGERIISSEDGSGKFMDVPESNLISVISNKQAEFENVGVMNNSLVGTNGSLDRYCKLGANRLPLSSKCPLVIINQIGDAGYTVVDYKGTIKKVRTSEVVEYAKKNGIANGKVGSRDNLEFISSIAGAYNILEIKSTRSGVNKGSKADIGKVTISVSKDASRVAKDMNVEVSNEINENDIFKSMTPLQKSVLKDYYVWYTVEVYKKLAKSIRLSIDTNKAEKLAGLRGSQDWEFAGVWDGGFMGASKCQLGHTLRYEYYAVPSDDRTNPDRRIIFGETCASDFFRIKPEDMRHLVKARTVMSDEIKEMADVLSNGLIDEYKNRTKLLYDILKKLGTKQKIIEVFGFKVGNTLVSFSEANLPFTQSLVKLCTKEISLNTYKFLLSVFPEYTDIITKCFGDTEYGHILDSAKMYFKFITNNKIEGYYAYDPFDTERRHKDEGKYNNSTRSERKRILYRIRQGIYCNKFSYDEIIKVFDTLRLMENNYVTIRDAYLEVFNTWDNETLTLEIRNKLGVCRYGSQDDEISDIEMCIHNSILLDTNRPWSLNNAKIVHKHSGCRVYMCSDIDELYSTLKIGKDNNFRSDITRYINGLKENKEKKEKEIELQMMRDEAEKEKKEAEELERIAKEEKKKKEEDAIQKQEMANDKVNRTKELIDSNTSIEKSYGAKIVESIANRHKLYKDLSPKQKYWVDRVYDEYNKESNVDIKSITNAELENDKYSLSEHPEIKNKVDKIIEMKDTKELKEALKENPNGLKIAYSIIRYGRASDKQLKHINSVYNKL